MRAFWKDTGKILGALIEWAWYLGLVVCAGFMAKVVWLLLRFGWRLIP